MPSPSRFWKATSTYQNGVDGSNSTAWLISGLVINWKSISSINWAVTQTPTVASRARGDNEMHVDPDGLVDTGNSHWIFPHLFQSPVYFAASSATFQSVRSAAQFRWKSSESNRSWAWNRHWKKRCVATSENAVSGELKYPLSMTFELMSRYE